MFRIQVTIPEELKLDVSGVFHVAKTDDRREAYAALDSEKWRHRPGVTLELQERQPIVKGHLYPIYHWVTIAEREGAFRIYR